MTVELAVSSSPSGSIRPIDILVVESSLGDARLLQKLFRDIPLSNALHVVSDADQAIEFLDQRGEYADAPRPNLILIDWHLINHIEHAILRLLAGHPDRSPIAVLILTGTTTKKDQITPAPHRVTGVLVKPISRHDVIDVVCSSDAFGISIVHHPRTHMTE